MLTYTLRTFSCPKAGNSAEENEDAFAVSLPASSESRIRFAISDGATESSFSKEWAKLLVDHYAIFSDFETHFFTNIFPAARKSWQEQINYVNLEWYAQQKLEMGAFASFLGFTIDLSTQLLQVSAVGDSNLMIFRDGHLHYTFPIQRADEFGNTPFLISTEVQKNQTRDPFFLQSNLPILPGDMLIAGTDAISHWVLYEAEQGNYPGDVLISLLENTDGPPAFQVWLDEIRATGKIKNDDTTLLLIQTI